MSILVYSGEVKKLFRWLIIAISLALIFVAGIFLFIRAKTDSSIYRGLDEVPNAQVAVILGAAILKSGDLSPVLEDRADKAIELYRANKVRKILITGNNSQLGYNEVTPVRKYLLRNNIPAEDIFLDYAGLDTYSSMYRARNVFLINSMIIVSQSFHLPRAIFIARALGLKAYGISADSGRYLTRNYIREVLADVKAVANIIFKREPKHSAKEIIA